MPRFCDVALAVPLDMAFTYSISDRTTPVLGGRVLVPFRQQRMSGVVVDLHDRPPSVTTKNILQVLDTAPVLDEQLLRLGRWIADYYLAPVGEVFRTMLPLSAEFKKSIAYRITEQGHMALHLAGMSGSPARSQRTPEDQLTEFRVLDFLAERDWIAEQSLRSSTRVSRQLLSGMVRKKWIAREDVSGVRDASRLIKVAVLLGVDGSSIRLTARLRQRRIPRKAKRKSANTHRNTGRRRRPRSVSQPYRLSTFRAQLSTRW